MNAAGFLAVGIGGKIVNGGQMEEMLDLALECGNLGGSQTQLGFGQITGDRNDTFHVPTHGLADLAEFLGRAFTYQHMHLAFAFQQVADQKTADEAGSACDEISHKITRFLSR